MKYVIALQGVQSEKEIDGQRKQVIPFVGTDREGKFAQLGVGFIFPEDNSATIWGLVMPHMLIQSWRAMKLLETIDRIEWNTLCACWYAGSKNVHSNDAQRILELAEIAGGEEKLEALRNTINVSVPSTEELDAMLTILMEKNIDVNSYELEEEIKAGRIVSTPLIEAIIKEAEKTREKYKREDEEIKRPLSPEESLGTFFSDLGIGNFIAGDDFDWFHIELEKMDSNAKRDSFSEYCPEGFRLAHTTQGPETVSAPVSAGITMYVTSFGEIEQPWFTAADGTKYTFSFAKFRDNHFFIKTKIEKSGEAALESDFKINELRRMIGPLPAKKRTFRSRIATLLRLT